MERENDDATTETTAPAAPPPRAWRTVALALRARTLHVGTASVRVLGGELVTEPDRVRAIRGDDAFVFVDLASPEHLGHLREDLTRAQHELRRRAAEMGLVVYRDGEVEPPKARS